MIRGYARPVNLDYSMKDQFEALVGAGCERIYNDKEELKVDLKCRPQWRRMMKEARPGDVIVVYRLSRAGHSLRFITRVILDCEELGLHFVSVKDGIDTRVHALIPVLKALADMRADVQLQSFRLWKGKRAKWMAERGIKETGRVFLGQQGAAEYAVLQERGYSRAEIAERLKCSVKNFEGENAKRVREDIAAGRI